MTTGDGNTPQEGLVYQVLMTGPGGEEVVVEYHESAPQSKAAWVIELPRQITPMPVIIRALPEMPEAA